MKSLIAIAGPLLLAGCASLSGMTGTRASVGQADALRAIGEHMDGCDRHYQGSLGLGGSFTFNIDCRSRAAPQDK